MIKRRTSFVVIFSERAAHDGGLDIVAFEGEKHQWRHVFRSTNLVYFTSTY